MSYLRLVVPPRPAPPAPRPDLVLERFAYTPMGTFGRLVMPDGEILYTIEDPWNENKVGQSCIPEGWYPCEPRRYNKGGYDAVHIRRVPGRSLILFHKANTHHDIMGCVGVASRLGYLRGVWAATSSAPAFETFMRHYGGKHFLLLIKRYEPENMEQTPYQFPDVEVRPAA